MIAFADIQRAREKIRGAVRETPLVRSEAFSQLAGAEVFLKLENLQMSGSFKERGALVRLLALSPDERARGVIAASAGNHAQGVAYHAQRLGIAATMVMPVGTPLVKVAATRGYGADIVLHGAGFDDAVAEAERRASDGPVLIHAFDDELIIAGQGTLGLELLDQRPDLDLVILPIGGGGLCAGTAMALKERSPEIRVVGVQTESVPSMKAALAGGAPVRVDAQPTIADGIAVRRVGARPLAIVARFVDDVVTVDEEEIANAILLLLEREKTLAEGAGAAALAALLHGKVDARGRRVAVVVSGGNLDVNVLARIIERGLVKGGRLVRLRVTIADVPGALHGAAGLVAELRANILQIHHDRALSEGRLGEVVVDLTLETRGAVHVEEILARFSAAGYRCHRVA